MLENLIPLLLPLWWSAATHRVGAWSGVLALYLIGAHEQPAAILRVLPDSTPLSSTTIWALHALILSLPWAWLWQPPTQAPAKRWLASAAVLLLGLLPPWGLIGWLHPLTLSGLLYPAWGWAGLLATLLLWGAWNAHQRPVISALLLASLLANSLFRPPSTPPGWQPLNTNLPPMGPSQLQRLERQTVLMQGLQPWLQNDSHDPVPEPTAQDPIRTHHPAPSVLLLPESIAGPWSAAEDYWWANVFKQIMESGTTLIMGAIALDPLGRGHNAAQLISARGIRWVRARQPIPLADWTPWNAQGLHSDWFLTKDKTWTLNFGQTRVGDLRVLFSFCFEDLLVLPELVSALGAGPPQALISLSNHWWANGLREPEVQALHALLWARLWGIPLLRADNSAPSSDLRGQQKASMTAGGFRQD